MKEIFVLIFLLFLVFFVSGNEKKSNYVVGSCNDYTNINAEKFIVDPLGIGYGLQEYLYKIQRAGGIITSRKGYNDMFENEKDVIYCIRYGKSYLYIINYYSNNSISYYQLIIGDWFFKMRGDLRIGVSKKAICDYFGLDYNLYKELPNFGFGSDFSPTGVSMFFDNDEKLARLEYYNSP